tara:strand:- start:610 stop:837 length:228 start_codon:yes stop_codon:yes gene_type:complete
MSDYINYFETIYNDTAASPMVPKDNFNKRFTLKITDSWEGNNDLFLSTIDLLNERLWFFMPVKKFGFLLFVPIDT